MFATLKRGYQRLHSPRSETWITLLATELLIIIVGVYAADLLAEWRDDRTQSAREALMLQGLREDIEPFIEQSERVIASIRTGYDAWTMALESGVRAPPFYVAATFSLSLPHGALWNAMLQSGGLELMPVDMLAEISEFYVRTDRMIDRYGRLDEFAKQQILPNIDRGDTYFFNGDGALRPMFSTYVSEAGAAIAYAEGTLALGRRIQERLAAQ